MIRFRLPIVTALVASCALASCTVPPPPAPEPTPAPKKREKVKPTPTPAPAPVAEVKPVSTPSPVPPSDQFKVTSERTPFYNYGPQQPGGPSLSLERGTTLTLLKRGFGYSQVKLKDQQSGYVATEDITALTPQELAATEAVSRPQDMGALPRPGGIRRSNIPPLTFDELPKPEPKPEATPKPGSTPAFRY